MISYNDTKKMEESDGDVPCKGPSISSIMASVMFVADNEGNEKEEKEIYGNYSTDKRVNILNKNTKE